MCVRAHRHVFVVTNSVHTLSLILLLWCYRSLFCSCMICYLMIRTTSHALPVPVLRQVYFEFVFACAARRRKFETIARWSLSGSRVVSWVWPHVRVLRMYKMCSCAADREKSETNKRSSLRCRSCFQALWDSGAAKRSNGHRLLASGVVFRRWSHVDAV